jgi:hypothetical protein
MDEMDQKGRPDSELTISRSYTSEKKGSKDFFRRLQF